VTEFDLLERDIYEAAIYGYQRLLKDKNDFIKELIDQNTELSREVNSLNKTLESQIQYSRDSK
jgi:hypothetical protein